MIWLFANALAPSVAKGEQVKGRALSALPDEQALDARLNVPLPVIGPPVSPVPLATLVTVPVPLPVAHPHAVPFHSSTWPLAQVFSRLRVGVPLVAPPLRPEPAAVVIPVMVPAPGNFCPVANVN